MVLLLSHLCSCYQTLPAIHILRLHAKQLFMTRFMTRPFTEQPQKQSYIPNIQNEILADTVWSTHRQGLWYLLTQLGLLW